jgi:putative chitinase
MHEYTINTKLLSKLPADIKAKCPKLFAEYGINNDFRAAHFLSQCDHESGGFKHVVENMNYSAKRLLEIFPKYFRTMQEAQEYANKPNKIGCKVYANRLGNGDEQSCDGYKFRGRGYIQCTGKNKYILLSKKFNVDLLQFPDKLATEYALESALWYWNERNINETADGGITIEVCEKVTKKVNGGRIGVLSRFQLLQYYSKLLNVGGTNGKPPKMD